MPTILPVRHQRPLPLDQLHPARPAGRRGDRDGRGDRRRRARRARLRDRAGAAGRGRTGRPAAAWPSSTSPCWRRPARLGEHSLSGAVVNPRAFRELFPDLNPSDFPFRQPVRGEAVYFLTEGRAQRIPTPPTMHNAGYYTASHLRDRALAGRAGRGAGRQPLRRLPGGLAAGRGQRGARRAHHAVRARPRAAARPATTPSPPTSPAKVTVLAEGTRGHAEPGVARVAAGRLAQPADLRARREGGLGDQAAARRGDPHPGLAAARPTRSAAASCIRWGRTRSRSARGRASTITTPSLDVHELLQRMKLHPLFRQYLEGGELLEWGAKTIPEGGYYALPERPHGDGVLLVGRRRRLRGRALAQGHPLRDAVRHATPRARRSRRSRRATPRPRGSRPTTGWWTRATSSPTCTAPGTCGSRSRTGSTSAGVKAGLMTVTGGRFSGGKIDMPEDAAAPRRIAPAEPFTPDGKLTFSKLDAVFKSGNATRDTIPSHLLVGPGHHRRGGRLLRARVPGRRLRAGGRRAPGERAELRRLQGDRRARAALDPARGRKRAQVPFHVVLSAAGAGSAARR